VKRALLLVGVAVLAACGGKKSAREGSLDGCAKGELVSFRVPGGGPVRALMLGDGDAGVVLSNESGNSACDWVSFADDLEHDGFRVLLYDYRYGRADAHIAPAVAELRRAGAKHVAIIGASLGGGATIVAGSRPGTDVDALVSLSGETFIHGVNDAVPRLRRPVFFIAAEGDQYGAGADARTMYREAPARDKKLLVIPGSKHGVAMLDEQNVRDALVDWLRSHLGKTD
jgi:dienelactone hydrolase